MYRNAITRTLQNVQKSCSFLSRAMSYETDPSKRVEKCINRITLLGRVGADTIVRQSTKNNTEYGLFPLATHSRTNESKQWHRVLVFNTFLLENIASTLLKGDRIYVTGKLIYRFNPESNSKTASIYAEEIINLTKKYLSTSVEESNEMDEDVVDDAKE